MISEREINAIQRLSARGNSQRTIAELLSLDRKTVSRALSGKQAHQRRQQATRFAASRKARRAVIAAAVKKKQNKSCMMYPSCQNLVDMLNARGIHITRHTVRRDLQALGFTSRVRRFVPSASPQVLARRVVAAKQLIRIPLRQLVFSDESYLTCDNLTHRLQWVKKKEDLLPRQKGQRGSCPYLMVWAAVGIGYKSRIIIWKRTKVENRNGNTTLAIPAMNKESYKRRCLMPVIRDLQGKTLIQDGAKPHTAKATQLYLQSKQVNYSAWPAHSPDMNLIEHVWGWLKPMVASKMPMTDDDLALATEQAWAEISQAKIDAMILKYRAKLRRVGETGGRY
jgi:predicted transcriptional regulator